MGKPVVQLVHLKLLYQANGSEKNTPKTKQRDGKRQREKKKTRLSPDFLSKNLWTNNDNEKAQQALIKQLSTDIVRKHSGMPVLLYTSSLGSNVCCRSPARLPD